MLTKEQAADWRRANRERIRSYHSAWRDANRARWYATLTAWRKSHPDLVSEHNRRQRERRPDAYLARRAVAHAIRSGALERRPCSVCGKSKAHAHHPNYAEPLVVIWLCVRHHKEEHRRLEGKAA
jgi:hypothetical protein